MGKQSVSAKRLASVMAILAMLIPVAGHALGLGDITMKSAFYQPLDAQIELLSAEEVDLNKLDVKLGSKEDFQRHDVAWTFFLTKIKFEVVSRKNGTAYIHLTTTKTFTEPFLNIIVEAHWPQGRILREFTVLLDLPVLSDEAPAPVQQAAVAPQAAPTVTRRAPAPAARHATIQSRAAMTPVSRHASELTYGPVKYNETLYEIANAMRPRGVTVDQMMLALVRNNLNAFYNGNVNQLKAGYMLRVDDPSELTAYSVADANAEINRQHNEWKLHKSGKLVHQADAPTDGPVARSEGTRASKGVDQPRLRLFASGYRGASSGADDRTVDQLREDLLLAAEELDAHRQENDELKFRLAEMVGQLKAMQRLVLLKDNEMRVLQAQSGAESVQAAAEMLEPEAVTEQTAAETLSEDSAAPAEVEMLAEGEETAPAPAPAAPAPMEAPGLLDNPMVMYGGPGVLLFIIVAVMIQRRRRLQDGFEESILNVGGGEDNAGVAAGSMGGGKSSMDSDFAINKTSGVSDIETDAADVDPISEASVSLADDIPNKELENEPECSELNIKLSDLSAGDSAEALKEELDEAEAVEPEQAAVEEFSIEVSELDIEESPETGDDAAFELDLSAKAENLLDSGDGQAEEAISLDDVDVSSLDLDMDGAEPALEVDPISKAYVYLAYGRHQQAEDILNEVLEKEPERHEIKLKLLEVFFAASNRESFEQLAQDFHDALGDESDPMWSRVVTMGAQLCSGNDLFAGDSAEALKEDLEEASSEADDDWPDIDFYIDSDNIDASGATGDAESDEIFAELDAANSGDVAAKEEPAAEAVEPEQAAVEEFSIEVSELDIEESPKTGVDAGLDIDPDDIDETEDPARHKKYKLK